MTRFRDLKEGTRFETDVPIRFGVKTGPNLAFMFDVNHEEQVHHAKNVYDVQLVQGRLAWTHDNRLCIVRPIKKGEWAAYYVNLAGYATLCDADLDLIKVEVGKRGEEVDIILQKLKKTRDKERKLFELLELELFE